VSFVSSSNTSTEIISSVHGDELYVPFDLKAELFLDELLGFEKSLILNGKVRD